MLRMQDNRILMKLASRAQSLSLTHNFLDNATKIAFMRLENLYYISDDTLSQLK